MKNKILKLSVIGFLAGMAASVVICFMSSGFKEIVPPQLVSAAGGFTRALLIQLCFAGLDGAICFATVILYDIESWPLAKSTVCHWAITAIVYIPVSLGLYWVSNASELLIVEAFMLAAYFVVWLIMCAIYRAQVRELNTLQQQYQKKQGGSDSEESKAEDSI